MAEFDAAYYLATYADMARAGVILLNTSCSGDTARDETRPPRSIPDSTSALPRWRSDAESASPLSPVPIGVTLAYRPTCARARRA